MIIEIGIKGVSFFCMRNHDYCENCCNRASNTKLTCKRQRVMFLKKSNDFRQLYNGTSDRIKVVTYRCRRGYCRRPAIFENSKRIKNPPVVFSFTDVCRQNVVCQRRNQEVGPRVQTSPPPLLEYFLSGNISFNYWQLRWPSIRFFTINFVVSFVLWSLIPKQCIKFFW